jgi:tetratricopeptide (TPR) repeat protein
MTHLVVQNLLHFCGVMEDKTFAKFRHEEQRRFLAAQGWFELGEYNQALREIRELPNKLQGGECVVALEWQICHARESWEDCIRLGRRLVEKNPSSVTYWLWLARAMRRARPEGIREARALLLGVYKRFKDPIFLFNLACYDAQLGETDSALGWLVKAFAQAKKSGAAAVKKLECLCATDADLTSISKEWWIARLGCPGPEEIEASSPDASWQSRSVTENTES